MTHEEIDQIIKNFNAENEQLMKEEAAQHLVMLTRLEDMAKAEMGFEKKLPLITVGIGWADISLYKAHGIEFHIVAKKVEMPEEYRVKQGAI